jgi:uncharacterized protein YbjT (DUF2867 family)
MRVLVTGAYGLIGSACLARLRRDGHELVGAGRAVAEAQRRIPFAQWVEADFRRLVSIESWRPPLANIDVVVNCVGVLQDSARDDLHRVHVTATCALFGACERLGIRRVIHISAIGVDEAGPTAFSRTKAQADRHLQDLDLDWVILRPALVLAPAVYGGSALLRALAAFPGAIPLIDADARIQIVGIDDVAETVAFCAAPDAPSKVIWELADPQVHTLADIAVAYRQWLGFPPRPVIRLPQMVGQSIALLGDQLGRLGWRSPARSTALKQLSAGVIGDPAPWMTATGIKPASLADVLARPATIQDRWSARLYLLKPLAIAGLAFHSIVSGLITARSLAGAVIDIVLGLAVLVRATARLALIGMLLVTVGAMVFEMAMLARYGMDRWLLATATAAVPMLLAIAFALATLDDR